jgi:integrase
MGVRKVNNSWWVDFQINKVRYRKRSPENSRSGAVAYETIIRQRLARGEPIDRDRKEQEVTFEKFAWKWFDEYVIPNNKYSEQRTKRTVLRSALIPFFGHMRLTEISARHIEQFKARQLKAGLARKTINNQLTVFRKCLSTAFEWLSLAGAPPKIIWLKALRPQADYLSPDECALLLSYATGVVYEMILTALRTGMRQGELKALQWSSIDWQARSITVQHSRCDYTGELTPPKSNRIRHIPMDIDVYEMLHARKASTGYVFIDVDGHPFNDKRLQRRLARICDQAGIRKIGWHTLRHTFASHLAMRGVPMTAVQMLMGHSSIATTMRYSHLAPSTLRAAIDMLNPRTAVDANPCQPAVNRWVEMQHNSASEKLSSQNDEEWRPKLAA